MHMSSRTNQLMMQGWEWSQQRPELQSTAAAALCVCLHVTCLLTMRLCCRRSNVLSQGGTAPNAAAAAAGRIGARESFESDWDMMGGDESGPGALSGAVSTQPHVNVSLGYGIGGVAPDAARLARHADAAGPQSLSNPQVLIRMGPAFGSGTGPGTSGGPSELAAVPEESSGGKNVEDCKHELDTHGSSHQLHQLPSRTPSLLPSSSLARKVAMIQEQVNALTDEQLLNPSARLGSLIGPPSPSARSLNGGGGDEHSLNLTPFQDPVDGLPGACGAEPGLHPYPCLLVFTSAWVCFAVYGGRPWL